MVFPPLLLPPPPQLEVTAPVRINPTAKVQPQSQARLRGDARTMNAKRAVSDIDSQKRISGTRKSDGGIQFTVAAFAVVVTVTVTVSDALELTTNLFRGSLVLIAQLAFGALVLQEK